MADEKTRGGTILKSADGSLYFIRDEVLAACKVSEKDMAKFVGTLANEKSRTVSGLEISAGNITEAVSVKGPFAAGDLRAVPSTVMCPGVMKDSAFIRVLPKVKAKGGGK